MKKFALFGRLELTQCPEWFPGFYVRHGAHPDKHVTLIQGRLTDEAGIARLKHQLDLFFKNNALSGGKIELVFDSVRGNPLWDCIMVDSKKSEELWQLQRALRELVRPFPVFEKPECEEYEVNFRPHITIADNMSLEETQVALSELPHEVKLLGTIKETVLTMDGLETSYFF